MLNNTITEDIISNIINKTYKFVVTQDSILSSLNERIDSLNFSLIFFVLFTLFSIIACLITIKKQKHLTIIVTSIFCILILGFFSWQCIYEINNIKYSIENNCWSIEEDIVTEKFTKKIHRRPFSIKYYVRTNKYQQIELTYYMFQNLEKNDKVSILCIQNKSGKKYPITYNIWPLNETLFIKSLPSNY